MMTTMDFTVGSGNKKSTTRAQFIVVDILDSSYNGLIGRPILTALRAIVCPLDLKLKFLTVGGIGEIRERENLKRPVPHAEIVKVPFDKEEPEKTFRIGIMLEYKDIFAWGPEDMLGIDTSVAFN
ncbi:hypothetical protein LIER_40500 [Lithospermum erythrorhizon]|uniref:Uncharacterized protein n=1 Tax=Lithospermum erythrorhizon TaxID=34254 RepID=A0AAV3QVJ0_LITER